MGGEMIERVTKAVRNAREMTLCSLCDGPQRRFVRCSCEEIARAALEAMREPSEAMMAAGGLIFEEIAFGPDADGSGIVFTDMGRVFTAMIDAALHSKAQGPRP